MTQDHPGLQVLEGVDIGGRVNVEDETLFAHMRSAIRRGHPQIKGQALKPDRVALVAGGPSLNATLGELRDLIAEGAKVVTVNGAYAWCLEHNIIPSMQVVMDARPSNARFFAPALPRCAYVLASQCHPACFDAVEGRPNVWIFHAVASEDAVEARAILDTYYGPQGWQGISGGTTVATRALAVLRVLGYLRFDLFGVDSCWMGDQHHAFPQEENAKDRRLRMVGHPPGHPELRRVFHCAPWHVQQLQDVLQFIRFNGEHFLLNVHGDGLIAYALQTNAVVAESRRRGEQTRWRLKHGASTISPRRRSGTPR